MKRYAIALAVCLVLLVMAFLVDAEIRPKPVTLDDVRGFGVAALLTAATAVIASMITAASVERSSEKRVVQTIATMEKVSRAVVEQSVNAVGLNILGAHHSPAVLAEVITSNLSSPLLRENFEVEMQFERVPRHPNAVLVKQIVKYKVINSSIFPAVFEPKFGFDQTALLYPNNPEYRSPMLKGVTVGSDVFSVARLNKINDQYRRQLTKGRFEMEPVVLGTYSLKSDDPWQVRIMWESVEPIDSHWVMRTFVPTKGNRITIRNSCGSSFLILILPLFGGEFGPVEPLAPDNMQWQQTYEGVILPNSGWLVRWNDWDFPPSQQHGLVSPLPA